MQAADLLLLAAVVAAAVGYAEGGRLAKLIGGWQVICWALVLSAPVLLIPTALSIDQATHNCPRYLGRLMGGRADRSGM